ncbi:MAG: thiamine pyrophosphate-dependent enzyme [bacterium]
MSPLVAEKAPEDLEREDYESGGDAKLCPGCGHNAITSAVKSAVSELSIPPNELNVVGGIGCSGKTIAEINANSIHTLHGCASPVAIGANLANPDQTNILISGDGDSWAIGAGKMIALLRTNLDMVYICENNGTYGLTKGQLSPTTDEDSPGHDGKAPGIPPVDGVGTAVMSGASYVAKSFSAKRNQLVEQIKAGILHDGLAYIDVLSPCVTFNDHEGSHHSYKWGQLHSTDLPDLEVIDIEDDYPSEDELETPITFEEFGHRFGLQFDSLDEDDDYDPTDKNQAVNTWNEYKDEQEIPLGLIYINEDREPHHKRYYGDEDDPIAHLEPGDIRPPQDEFDQIVDRYT